MSEIGEEGRQKVFLQENKILMGFGVAGAGLLLLGGMILFRDQLGRQSSVEIISSGEATSAASTKTIWVDVEGAVVNAGVYELSMDARVNEALTAAGGMNGDADRIWVRRFINLAQRIPDGAKIYIPVMGEAHNNNQLPINQLPISDNVGQTMGVTTGGVMGEQQNGLVNINAASKSELDSLWGIGEKRAEAIISNRPYSNVDELKSKAGIPQNVFDRIKNEVGI